MIELRPAAETDLAQLTALWQEHRMILSLVDQRFRRTAGGDVRWMNTVRDKNRGSDSYFCVADAGSSVVGYGLGTVRRLPHTQAGVIEELVLDAHRYYGGLGRRLAVALRAWFEEQGGRNDLCACSALDGG
ncbi:GNAT family N-acetyltransferase [bacterium]|nr:GNAT family N-acetyltransferase [bacterium]